MLHRSKHYLKQCRGNMPSMTAMGFAIVSRGRIAAINIVMENGATVSLLVNAGYAAGILAWSRGTPAEVHLAPAARTAVLVTVPDAPAYTSPHSRKY